MKTHDAEYWAAVTIHERIRKTKLCLAETDTKPCSSPIIRAHTIPRAQLRKIAVAGHVCAISGSPADLEKNDGRLAIREFGISNFSVLNCFCAEHDNSIFSNVEDRELVFDDQQIALLHYRAIGAELYKKMMAHQSSLAHLEEFKAKPQSRANRQKIEFLEDFSLGEMLAIKDLGESFKRCEEAINLDPAHQISSLILHFKEMPSVMTVGGFIPEFDYQGRFLQKLDALDVPCQGISINILAPSNHAAFALSWFKGDEKCRTFAESLLAESEEIFTTLAIQTAFEFIENTCMNPKWWGELKGVERRQLITRMETSINPTDERKANCLGYGGITFDDWKFDRYEFINT
jgi:hypothetical protein